ncbi:MAG TPA: FxsA family protein [Marmoricola sp.]
MTARRTSKWPWLLLALIAIPVIEIAVLIQVGEVIGPWWTILLLLLDGMFGTWLIKHEGRRAWTALQSALQQGRLPATELADGILILVGGTLMLAPGFVTDVFGMLMILPFTRPIGRRILAGILGRRLLVVGSPLAAATARATGTEQAAQRPGHDDVIRGEVIDD